MAGWDDVPDSMTLQTPKSGWGAVPDAAPRYDVQPVQQAPAWAANNKPFTLSNGAQTQLRQDGYVWLDPSKGDASKNGWYKWTGNGWEQGPPEPQAPKKSLARSIAENLLFNPVSQGMTDPMAGAIQFAANTPGMPQEAKDFVNNEVRAREQAYQQLPMNQTWMAGVNRAIGGTLPMLAMPQLAGIRTAKLAAKAIPKGFQVISEAAPGLMARIGVGASEGAVAEAVIGAPEVAAQAPKLASKVAHGVLTGSAAAAAQPVEVPEGQGNMFLRKKSEQMGIGAVLGGLVPVAAAGFSKLRGAWGLTPEAQQIRDLGEKWGVRTSAADEGAGTRKMEAMTADIPLSGMPTWLKGQKDEAGQAANRLLGAMEGRMKALGWQGLDDVMVQANGSGPRAKEAQALLRGVDDAESSRDWSKIVQTSGGMKVFGEKLRADQLYGKAEALAPDIPVPTPSTHQAIQEIRKQLSSTPGGESQNKALLGYLDVLETDLASDSGKDLTYSGISSLRSSLRNLKQNANSGTGDLAGTEGGAALAKLQSAVERDQADFAKQMGGDFASARKAADTFYRFAVVPYKDKALVKALENAHPDEVFQQFILKGGLEDRAHAFYKLLEPKGQEAVRVGLVSRAVDEATKTGHFSPDVFAGQMRNYRGARNAIFSGQAKWELDGFTNLMKAISGSSAFAQASPNGRSVIQYLLMGEGAAGGVGLALGNPQAAAPIAGTIGTGAILKKLFTTRYGKDLLLSASSLDPGSQAMQKVIEEKLPMLLGTGAGGRGRAQGKDPWAAVPDSLMPAGERATTEQRP